MAAVTRLTGTSYVILGMLALGRRSGYDIKALVDVSTRFFWAASYGQIYPELRRLEQAGLIAGEDAPQGGRQRRVYALTEQGDAGLRDWLTDPESSYELRDEAMLKLFFADVLSPPEALEIVRSMRTRHAATVERLRAIEPAAAASDERFPHLILEYGLGMHQWVVDWCDRAQRELEAEQTERGDAEPAR